MSVILLWIPDNRNEVLRKCHTLPEEVLLCDSLLSIDSYRTFVERGGRHALRGVATSAEIEMEKYGCRANEYAHTHTQTNTHTHTHIYIYI